MMINKRLIGTVKNSKKYIAGNVAFQWGSLAANIGMIFTIAAFLEKIYEKRTVTGDFIGTGVVFLLCIAVRFVCSIGSGRMGFLSSQSVKLILREKIYKKLLRLGSSYHEKISTSSVVQMAVEGVDQLESYFGAYLPQFFYSMIAPLTLFVILAFINLPSAIVLFVCVPIIPAAIAGVQTFAKKLLAKYWGKYTSLGDTFLENLQGLTTLKIYQSDEMKNQQMNQEAEEFRKITMKVLTMQLNSITIMDLVAYGGAALGIILAVNQFREGNVALGGCIAIILLSADFFIPMRLLGSYFHIAMNGMAASDKIFCLLDMEEEKVGDLELTKEEGSISCKDVRFSYEEEREVLHGIELEVPKGSFTAIVGESGCGKSTLAGILTGALKNYKGEIRVGEKLLSQVKEESLMSAVTYISHNSYLFKGTVRENLRMGKADATEEEMWAVLEQTKLQEYLKGEQGLDTILLEKASNLSGGQCQRLALSRALLHDSPIYIFDEATSNIDVESENDIMEQIDRLAKNKTIIMISHRLLNVVEADCIYVLKKGYLVEQGSHGQLLKDKGTYAKLWKMQQDLENYGEEADSPWKKEVI